MNMTRPKVLYIICVLLVYKSPLFQSVFFSSKLIELCYWSTLNDRNMTLSITRLMVPYISVIIVTVFQTSICFPQQPASHFWVRVILKQVHRVSTNDIEHYQVKVQHTAVYTCVLYQYSESQTSVRFRSTLAPFRYTWTFFEEWIWNFRKTNHLKSKTANLKNPKQYFCDKGWEENSVKCIRFSLYIGSRFNLWSPLNDPKMNFGTTRSKAPHVSWTST